MKLRIFIMVIVAGFMLTPYKSHADTPSLREDDKENVQQIGLKFAQCSGIYEAVSEVHAVTNAPALAKSTKETSNGAWLASSYLMFTMGIIPDWKMAIEYAKNTASTVKVSYMASFEKPDVNKSLGELTDAMKECNKLLEYQEKLVQEARLKVYSKQTPTSEKIKTISFKTASIGKEI